MDRAEFLRRSCGLVGLGLMAGCAGYKVLKAKAEGGRVRIPLAEFGEKGTCLLRVPGVGYDILVRRLSPGSVSALLLKCTHHDWDLKPDEQRLVCSQHGSEFDWMGHVRVGPATQNLKTYPAREENGEVWVEGIG